MFMQEMGFAPFFFPPMNHCGLARFVDFFYLCPIIDCPMI